MSKHDDILDGFVHAFNAMGGSKDVPVWFITKDDNLQGIIQHDEADTWQYRRMAEAKYPNCCAWAFTSLGWCHMSTNNMRSSIWIPREPPAVVLMAKLLEI